MDNKYYFAMLTKDRLVPFWNGKEFICLITFYIDDSIEKYVNRENQWEVMNDNPLGSVCYVDHLLTSKDKRNPHLSYEIWKQFRWQIKMRFPNVEEFRWNRFKNDKVKTYSKKTREALCIC